ncbi:MAG: hypothetical protein WCI95_11670 [bacterium]
MALRQLISCKFPAGLRHSSHSQTRNESCRREIVGASTTVCVIRNRISSENIRPPTVTMRDNLAGQLCGVQLYLWVILSLKGEGEERGGRTPPPAPKTAPPPPTPPSAAAVTPSTMEECWDQFCQVNKSKTELELYDLWPRFINEVTGKTQMEVTPQGWGKVRDAIGGMLPF